MHDAKAVLVIDDEQSVGTLLKLNLRQSGFRVETAETAGNGRDRGLPDAEGFGSVPRNADRDDLLPLRFGDQGTGQKGRIQELLSRPYFG